MPMTLVVMPSSRMRLASASEVSPSPSPNGMPSTFSSESAASENRITWRSGVSTLRIAACAASSDV